MVTYVDLTSVMGYDNPVSAVGTPTPTGNPNSKALGYSLDTSFQTGYLFGMNFPNWMLRSLPDEVQVLRKTVPVTAMPLYGRIGKSWTPGSGRA